MGFPLDRGSVEDGILTTGTTPASSRQLFGTGHLHHPRTDRGRAPLRQPRGAQPSARQPEGVRRLV